MNVGIALVPSIATEIEELGKICGTDGIRKAVPLVRDDMVEKLTTAEALASVASAQELILNSWKSVEAEIQAKRTRVRNLLSHWTAMLQIIRNLHEQKNKKEVRYVIAHQMQAKASVVPDGRVVIDIGAGVFVEFSYDEAEERLSRITEVVQQSSDRLLEVFEECKRNVVTSEVNISQLHNFGVEFRDMLVKSAPSL